MDRLYRVGGSKKQRIEDDQKATGWIDGRGGR
ncbi:hypothetical protein V757_03555 [Pelistega indica]|uniref:Uncharacterized protein n=1 Tax=Pelistega indica TaxID=1414851 RepID=V8G8Y8_9BURK|nr:hypothetical protein V757_03555 [Pelistega indica]